MSLHRGEAGIELLTFWRRMVRSKQACAVLAVELGALQLIQENPRSHRVQKRMLEDLATRQRGQFFALPDGGVILAVPRAGADICDAMTGEIVDWILRDPSLSEEGIRRRVHAFVLPDDYKRFREWIAPYLPGGDSASLERDDDADPSGEALTGALTARLRATLHHRISRLDIRPFIHRQMVYRHQAVPERRWAAVVEGWLIGVASLASKHFPDVELDRRNPYHREFCSILDERLILHLMTTKAHFLGPVSLNLSLDTVLDRLFDDFAVHMPPAELPRLHVEIDCVEIFADVGRARSAISHLRSIGCGVIVDGMTLDLLPYVRVNRFDFDFLKIHLPRHEIGGLMDNSCIKAIRNLPHEKIVFTRCDTDGALAAGRMLDVGLYQGWHVDDLAEGRLARA